MRECRKYDRFSSVALSCHREIVPEVILYYYDVYCNNKNIILVRFINHVSLLLSFLPLSHMLSPSHHDFWNLLKQRKDKAENIYDELRNNYRNTLK